MVTKPRDWHSLLERSTEYGAAAHRAVTCGVASAQIAEASENRRKITFINDSANTIYIAKGVPAVVNIGIRLNANGGSWIEEPDNLGYFYRGNWFGIATGAASNLLVIEDR